MKFGIERVLLGADGNSDPQFPIGQKPPDGIKAVMANV